MLRMKSWKFKVVFSPTAFHTLCVGGSEVTEVLLPAQDIKSTGAFQERW